MVQIFLTIIVLYFISIAAGIVATICFDKDFFEYLPIYYIFIIMVLYFFGLAEMLIIGVYVISAIILIMYIMVIVNLIRHRKNRKNKLLSLIKSDNFLIFTIFYIFIIWSNLGKVAHQWDEFTCWIQRVKAMSLVDKLYSNTITHADAISYAPSVAMFQYYFQKIQYFVCRKNVFVDWYCYIAYQLVLYSLTLPILQRMKPMKKVKKYFVAVILFGLPIMFEPYCYDGYFVDAIIGVAIGYSILVFWENDFSFVSVFKIFSIQFLLCQLKSVGMYFSVVLLLVWICGNLIKRDSIEEKIRNTFLLMGVMLVSIVSSSYSWNQKLIYDQKESSIGVNTENALASIRPKWIVLELLNIRKEVDYRIDCFYASVDAFFSHGVKFDLIPFNIAYFLWCTCFIIIFIYIIKNNKSKDDVIKVCCSHLSIIILFFLYYLIITLSYMFIMSSSEAMRLAGFERYMNSIVLAGVYVIVFELTQVEIVNYAKYRFIICGLIGLVFPYLSVIECLDRQDVWDSWQTRLGYIDEVQEIDKIINNKDSICCVQFNDNNPMLLFSYQLQTEKLLNDVDCVFMDETDLMNNISIPKGIRKYDYVILYDDNKLCINANCIIPHSIEHKEFEIYRVTSGQLERVN